MENTLTTTNYTNKALQKATTRVIKLHTGIQQDLYEIAAIIAGVDAAECYKDDGFNNVHEWTAQAFGYKKSASYDLLKVGREFVVERVGTDGKKKGYGSCLTAPGLKDYTTSQLIKLLPVGKETAYEMTVTGEVSPGMSVREIAKIVKAKKEGEKETGEAYAEPLDATAENEPEPIDTTEEAEAMNYTMSVWDADGVEYVVPIHIINAYRKEN